VAERARLSAVIILLLRWNTSAGFLIGVGREIVLRSVRTAEGLRGFVDVLPFVGSRGGEAVRGSSSTVEGPAVGSSSTNTK